MLKSFPAQTQESFEVSDIRVEGLSRISAETIFSYLPVGIGDEIDEEKFWMEVDHNRQFTHSVEYYERER